MASIKEIAKRVGLGVLVVGLGGKVAYDELREPPAIVRSADGFVPTPTATLETKDIIPTITGIVPAEKRGDQWVLQHPDGGKTELRTLPEGFTPDRNLYFATDIQPLPVGTDLSIYQDWETALNTKRPEGPLAGYNYDYNDYCPVPGFACNMQADMYAWRTIQGEEVEVPGIGKLVGGPRRSVVLNILNLDGSVHAWDEEKEKNGPVEVKHGFTATGRIFNGEKDVDALERSLSGHWLFRQAYGTPEKSYIGITDSPENAQEVLLVSVQRKQWGFNSDGIKRMEFQLIRAELVRVK